MLSRTLIRIKAFKELYSRVTTGSSDSSSAEKEVVQAFVKTRELYCLLSLLPYSLAVVASDKISAQNRKFNPDNEAIAFHKAMADNPFSALVRSDSAFMNFCTNSGISWGVYENSLKSIYAAVLQKDYYRQYAELQTPGMKDALNLFKNIYAQELSGNQVLEDELENSCIWWIEDLEYVINQILDGLNKVADSGKVSVPPVFANKEDENFALKLTGTVLVNYDDLTETVSSHMQNWEVGRVVQSDILIVAMGLAEAQTFSSIPLKVTINEYVEIAKNYSTPKSYSFVNGLLNRILSKWCQEGKINKDMRGLAGGLI